MSISCFSLVGVLPNFYTVRFSGGFYRFTVVPKMDIYIRGVRLYQQEGPTRLKNRATLSSTLFPLHHHNTLLATHTSKKWIPLPSSSTPPLPNSPRITPPLPSAPPQSLFHGMVTSHSTRTTPRRCSSMA